MNIPETELVKAIRADPPHWATQRIGAWNDNAFREAEPFIVEKYWSGQQSMNVFEVVGTQHPDYQGLTWMEFLERGKRMRKNLLLQEENPSYYLDDALKTPAMYYVAIDGAGWHVAGDGNHRTSIARFMFHKLGRTMLHGVDAVSYRTDSRAQQVFSALREEIALRGLTMLVEPFREKLSREDTAGWMRESFHVGITLRNPAKGTSEVLTVCEAERKLDEIRRKNRLRLWWRRIVLG